jgi:hypothetical protein
MKEMVRQATVIAGTFLGILASLLSMLPGVALAQTPGRRIGINPEYAFPTKDTPAGGEVNSASLVENANLWDGRIVTFKGEAVGERMVRGESAWIHLNDDTYMEKNSEEGAALGGYNSGHAVWVSAELAQKIRFFGDYKHEGDLVKVTGVFHAACPEHGGDMDIHASSLEILRPGHSVPHAITAQRMMAAAILLMLASLLYGFRRRAERRRV